MTHIKYGAEELKSFAQINGIHSFHFLASRRCRGFSWSGRANNARKIDLELIDAVKRR